MNNLGANESRVFGVLGAVIGVLLILCLVVLLKSGQSVNWFFLLAALGCGWFGLIGLNAKSLYLDGGDILIGDKSTKMKRIGLEKVIKARTIPFGYSLDIIWIVTTDGTRTMSVVRQHDTLFLMFKMKRAAITSYWQGRIG